MATKRMMISMTPELHSVLFAYAEAVGQPAARCVVDLLEELKPQLQKTTKVCLLARQNRLEDASKALLELSEELVAKASQAQQMILPIDGMQKE